MKEKMLLRKWEKLSIKKVKSAENTEGIVV